MAILFPFLLSQSHHTNCMKLLLPMFVGSATLGELLKDMKNEKSKGYLVFFLHWGHFLFCFLLLIIRLICVFVTQKYKERKTKSVLLSVEGDFF